MASDIKNANEDAEMADCDGERVVTMMDVLKEQADFEEDANAVLGGSDDKNCTYSKGYVKRQALYACLTCCSDAKSVPDKRAGVCLACSLTCHENHDLIELYTKRNFKCDCGNSKFNSHPCSFTSTKTDSNEANSYNQNFSGLYCTCHRPYPDLEDTQQVEMIQCIICEDWLHSTHLDANVPSNNQYSEMICKQCMDKNEFLHDYSEFVVNAECAIEIACVNGNEGQQGICNDEPQKDAENTNVDVEILETKLDVCSEDMTETKPVSNESTTIVGVNTQEKTATERILKVSENVIDGSEHNLCKSQEGNSINEQNSNISKENSNINEPSVEETKADSETPENNSKHEESDTASTDVKENDILSNTVDQDTGTEGTSEKPDGHMTENKEQEQSTQSLKDQHLESANKSEAKENRTEISNEEATEEEKEKLEEDRLLADPEGESHTEVTKQEDSNKNAENNSTENTKEIHSVDNTEANSDPKENLAMSQEKPAENCNEQSETKIVIDAEMETVQPDCYSKQYKIQSNENTVDVALTIEDKSPEKRKLLVEDSSDDLEVKKPKLESENEDCSRPKGVKRVHKGATFWPSIFRQRLCTCQQCITIYKDLSVLFLIDPEDTVIAYENLGKEIVNGKPLTQYEKGLEALSSLDRIQQINALTEYNNMRDKLLDFLKSFKDRKEIVKEEDIKAFFADMKPKREPDGVYFCR